MQVIELLRGACVTEQFAYYALNFINEYIFYSKDQIFFWCVCEEGFKFERYLF